MAPGRRGDPRRRRQPRLAHPPAARDRGHDRVAGDPRGQARRSRRAAAWHCARRELVEEIGKEAGRWEELEAFYTSPGFSDERVWLFLATELRDAAQGAEPDDDERIEIVPWPLDDLDGALAESEDSKTLIALLWLARERERGRFTAA